MVYLSPPKPHPVASFHPRPVSNRSAPETRHTLPKDETAESLAVPPAAPPRHHRDPLPILHSPPPMPFPKSPLHGPKRSMDPPKPKGFLPAARRRSPRRLAAPPVR